MARKSRRKPPAHPVPRSHSRSAQAAPSREYVPLDPSTVCNAGQSLSPQRPIPLGPQTWHGLPFLIGGKKPRPSRCVIAAGRDLTLEPIILPVPAHLQKSIRYLIFAHRLLQTQIPQGAPVGEVCADYIIHYADGATTTVPIRERLEIGIVEHDWGQWPIVAAPDEKDQLHPRYQIDYAVAGRRLCEAESGRSRNGFLWPWQNPRPQAAIVGLEIRPHGPRFYVLGVTCSYLEEYPINRNAKRAVKLLITDKTAAHKPFDLAVEVDRGVAHYPYPLPTQSSATFLQDGFKGWGEAKNESASPAYVEIAANPSATVTIKQDGKKIGSFRFGDLEKRKKLKAGPALQTILVDEGRNWIKTTVLDDDTGKPVPCRIHFRSIHGVPFQPHGHHSHIVSDLNTWHMDVGGDLRLGQASYAYITGECEGWLPRGEILVDIARGFEYEPIRKQVTIQPGQQKLTFRLKRLIDMKKQRYFSGDTHVHFLSTQGSHREAAGEGLNVVNLLQSQWGSLFTNTEEFTGKPSQSDDGETVVYATQENRQHILGHLTLLGLKQPIHPWCSGGPDEAENGGNLETTLSRWADECHAQGGTVVLPHIPNPNCEPAALITTGRVDATEFIDMSEYKHLEYYKYLNCGYKLPIAGGTDKMSSEVPVGMYRTYVHIPASEPFNYDTWCKYLKAGNTFHSGGPLLWLKVDGKTMGDTLDLPGNGGEVEIHATALSSLPITVLEIIVNGEVVARRQSLPGGKQIDLREKITITKHAWIAARCAGGPTGDYFAASRHHDVWKRGLMAHTSPVYLAVGEPWWMFDAGTANYLLTLLHGGLDYINTRSMQWRPDSVTHRHGKQDHLAFLGEPFKEAIAALHKRMHELGLPH